jgi:predicted alpha/beta-hydrolase family hydrolase
MICIQQLRWPPLDLTKHIIENGRPDARQTIILAHGAGSGKEHAFLNFFAENLATRGFRVVRFDFPYMVKARESGRRRPPDRQPVLLEAWRAIIDCIGAKSLIIGGKSMGGRMASLIADQVEVRGLVCLGYPFHAPGKPDSPRIEHLETLRTPTLICQGTRDPFGRQEEVGDYDLSKSILFQWLEDGEHSFKPRKSSGRTEHQNLDEAVDAIDDFAKQLM